MFIAQVLVGPSKQRKQIIQIEHNIVKNPNWSEANQLAIYKRGRWFELGTSEKQIQVVVRAGLEPGTAGLRVRQADHSVTLPRLRHVTLIFKKRWFKKMVGSVRRTL